MPRGMPSTNVAEHIESLRHPRDSAITRTDRSIRGNIILHAASILVPDLADQDARFSAAFSILSQAIEQHAFPAASIAVTLQGKLLALKSLGHFVYEEDLEGAPPKLGLSRDFALAVTPSTIFDLASLTKPVATTTMAMILYERGLLELDAPIAGTIPEFRIDGSDQRRSEVTFRMLLAHSSGLPAYEKLFLRVHTREELLHTAFTMPLAADPGSRAEYSDTGFIILGEALERIAEEPLDVFCQREIFGPLGMANTGFHPPEALHSKIPPTADERDDQRGAGAPAREKQTPENQPAVSPTQPRNTFRHRIIQGEVQDENASVLGGIAGHAGLFSTAEELAIFAQTFLAGGSPILLPETVALFTHRESGPDGTSRALGWDTPSSPSQSGKHFGPRSYGHLGYTGTSLWIDPDRQLSITLLTNRTWPDCSNQVIKQVRPMVHDAIMEAIL